MTYLTVTALLTPPGIAAEVAELFGVPADLLVLVEARGDTSGYDADEVADADDAITTIEATIAEAQGEVDAALSTRYTLPIATPASYPLLALWTRALARYALHARRDHTGVELGRIERDAEAARQRLDLVRRGEATFGAGSEALLATCSLGAVQISTPGRTFTATTLAGYTA